jgi:hypothetical protein
VPPSPRGAEPQGKEGKFSAALLLLLPRSHSLTHPSPNALLRLRPGLAVAVAYKGGAAEESRGEKARRGSNASGMAMVLLALFQFQGGVGWRLGWLRWLWTDDTDAGLQVN